MILLYPIDRINLLKKNFRFNSLEHERQQKLKYEKQLAQIQNYVKKSPLHPKILQDLSNFNWCHGFLKYLDPPGPLTALASYPGSGNTWIRYLIQQATGIASGSVYNSSQFRQSCFPAEGIYNGSVIAIKTHVGR